MQPASEIPLNLEYISAYSKKNINKGLLYSILRILETGGYLKTSSEFENRTSFQFSVDKDKLKEFVKNSSSKNLKETILALLRIYGSKIFTGEVQLFNPFTANGEQSLASQSGLGEEEIDKSLIILDNLGLGKYSKSISKNNVLLTSPRIKADRLQIDYKRINESYLNLQRKINMMTDYVFNNECRFKYILKYFGEDVENYKCNNCDNCRHGEKFSSESIEYLKEIILKTLHKTGAISELTLISILTGSTRSEKHNELETFGICSNYQKNDLKIVLHDLISHKFVKRKKTNNKNIELDEEGINYLTKINVIETQDVPLDYETDIELFNALREIRKRVSKKFMQTGYLICPDEILKEIVKKKPLGINDFFSIKGFNQRMFNKIGNEFLEAIRNFNSGKKDESQLKPEKGNVPQNIKETYLLLKRGYSLSSIASLRNLSEAVISMQVETIIEYEPGININNLIDQENINKINGEIEKGFTDLKDLKKRLPSEISYPLIRIAVAKNKFTSDSYSSKFRYEQKLY